MKVCHITTLHPDRYDTRIFKKECISLAKTGFEVVLLVNDTLPDEIRENVQILSLNSKYRNAVDRAVRIVNKAYRKALEVDAVLYHLHDPELLRIAVKLVRKGKKVIFDSHEFTAEQVLTRPYLSAWSRGLISWIYRKYETRVLNQLSGLICPCTYRGADYFSAVDIPKTLIDNYPSIESFKRMNIQARNETPEIKIGYLGSITEPRGIYQMVKAAARAGIKLTLIGPIPTDIHEKLKTMPEYENTECLGRLNQEEALREISKCSIGLSLIQNEGQYANIDNLPTKVYEYMMLGIPVVMSDFPYYKRVLKKYRFGITVPPDDVKAIADAITGIINNKELLSTFSNEGKRAIDEEMNWERESDKLISFYNDIVASL